MKIPNIFFFMGSGILFGFAFVFSFLFFLFLPAFVLFLYGIEREHSWYRLFFYGMLAGTLHYAGSFFWVWSAYPILWLTEQPPLIHFIAIGAYWVLTSLAMGIAGGVFALAVKPLFKLRTAYLILVPFLWVASEVLKSLSFSIYSFGPGSFLSASFSYGYVGYLLAEIPFFLKASVVFGVYGLSCIAAALGLCFYLALKAGHIKTVAISTCALLVLSFIPVPTLHDATPVGKKVIALEAWFPNEYLSAEGGYANRKVEAKEAVRAALQHNPDYIVLPEDVRIADSFEGSDAFWKWLKEQTESTDVIVIDNGPMRDARGVEVIRSYMYDLSTESAYVFDKRYLVPQGEYMSYFHTWLLSLFVSDETLKGILSFARFVPGMMSDGERYPDHLPGILFCFETMVPYGALRASSFRDPDFVAHPISHAWFADPFSLETQLYEMLRVSAVWSATPIVSAGSMTPSLLFLPNGAIEEGEVLEEREHWKLKEFSI